MVYQSFLSGSSEKILYIYSSEISLSRLTVHNCGICIVRNIIVSLSIYNANRLVEGIGGEGSPENSLFCLFLPEN